MKRLLVGSFAVLMLTLLSAPAWAVAISSATINYSTTPNTITINGFGFGLHPQVYFGAPVPNAKVFPSNELVSSVQTLSKISQVITASLPATPPAPGTYELIVLVPGVGAARYEMTYGAASGADVGALTTRFTNLSTSKTGVEAGLNTSIGNTESGLENEVMRAEGAEAGLLPLSGGTLSGDLTVHALTAGPAILGNTEVTSGLSVDNGLAVLSGALTLSGDPTSGNQAATKNYVDAQAQAAVAKNPSAMQAALMQWYNRTYTVGSYPRKIAFDGTNIWVTNYGDNTVTVLNAATGAPTSFSPVHVGTSPEGIAFDGTNMWVLNIGDSTVSVINAATGKTASNINSGNPISAGSSPRSIAFDGVNNNIWVGYNGGVTVLNASTGTPTGFSPISLLDDNMGIAFDGTNMWVAGYNGGTVTEIDASTGVVGTSYSVGTDPAGVAFDGTNIWVTSEASTSVTVINAATGTPTGFSPLNLSGVSTDVAFDGTNIWVSSGSVQEYKRNGALVSTYNVNSPWGIAFDGANMWVTNYSGNTVTRIPAR